MKKWLNCLVAALLMLTLSSPAMAASSKGRSSLGGSSSHISTSTSSMNSGYTSSGTQGKVYNSGTKRPSSTVTNQQSPTYTNQPTKTSSYAPAAKTKSSWGSFLGGMAVGGLLGSMFHPFGSGMYNGGMQGFSFTGLILDAILIAGGFWLIRRMFRRA
jgi:hypothetical protein